MGITIENVFERRMAKAPKSALVAYDGRQKDQKHQVFQETMIKNNAPKPTAVLEKEYLEIGIYEGDVGRFHRGRELYIVSFNVFKLWLKPLSSHRKSHLKQSTHAVFD